jgi:signal peptidase I
MPGRAMEVPKLAGLFKKKEKPQTGEEVKLSWPQRLVLDFHDLVHVLAVFMVVYILLFRVVVVVGPSMYNTLVDGDRLVLVSNVLYRNPKQGDVIVASKETFRDGECIIKRIIATENQTVDIDFQQGIVYVDGIALQEDYTYTMTNLDEGMKFPLTVPEGCVFAMGDNRNSSMDSRNPQIGFVDQREILGKAVFLLMPGTHGGTEQAQYDRIGFEVFR